MIRTGKIARLPRAVREALNLRLQDGEAGQQLVAWLNSRDDVRAVLTAQFAGRPITEQNLSEWRQGGYADWLKYQDTRSWVRSLVERSSDLTDETGEHSIADWLAPPVAVALGHCFQNLAQDASTSLAFQKNLLALARELSHLRRGDYHQQILRLQRERWEAQKGRLSDPVQPNPT